MQQQHQIKMGRKKTIINFVFVIVYLAAVFTSVSYAKYRYYNLSQHRDLGFFLEFPAKILDPKLANRYIYASGGTNIFGQAGFEGEHGFFKTTHFSPIKYTYILIYKLFPGPMGLFVYFSSLFFLPVLYFPLIHSRENWLELTFIILFVFLFVIAPNTLLASTGEIRPRLLYSAFIPLAFLAIQYKRPLIEKVILFTALLAIREEGIIFGLLLIIYSAIHLSNNKDKKKTIQLFSFIYLINLFVVIWYFFIYTNFPYSEGNSNLSILSTRPTLLTGFIVLGIVYICIVLILWRISRSKNPVKLWGKVELNKHGIIILKMLVFALFFLPYIVISLTDVINKMAGERTISVINAALIRLLSHYWFSIIFIFLLLMFVILWDEIASQKCKKRVLLILIILFFCSSLIFYQAHPNFPSYFSASSEKQPIAPLMDLRDITDPYETNILVGYKVYPIFYDYNNIFLYWLLPVDQARMRERRYPQNTEILSRMIDEEIDYIAITRSDLIRLEPIIADTQTEMTVYAENEEIIIFNVNH